MSWVISSFGKKFSRKFLSSFLFFSFLLPGIFLSIPPKEARAQWYVFDGVTATFTGITSIFSGVTAGVDTVNTANSTAQSVKSFFLDTLATGVARAIVQGLTAQTVNWINSGFNGNPAFVTNPQQFFTQTADYAVSKALDQQTGGLFNRLCTPFAPQIRLALVSNYLNQNRIGQCSLGQIGKNYDSFTQNFLNGGWDSWFVITQNMQNNPYGAFLASQDELQITVANQTGLKKTALQQNAGFLNYKKCTTTQLATGPTNGGIAPIPDDSGFNNCLDGTDGGGHFGNSAYCQANFPTKYIGTDAPVAGGDSSDSEVPDYTAAGNTYNASVGNTTCQTVTPGAVIRDQLGKSLGAAWDQLDVTNSINQIMNALITQAAKAVIGGVSGGLRSLGSDQTSASNPRPLGAQLQPGSTESNAQAQHIYASSTAQVPGNLQYSAGLSNTPDTSLNPNIDLNALQAKIDQESANFQSQHPVPSGSITTGATGGTGGGTNSTALSSASDQYQCSNPAVGGVGGQNQTVCSAITALQNGTTDATTLFSDYKCNTGQVVDANTCTMLNGLTP